MAKRRITYSFGADLSELEQAVKRINSKLGQLGREAERMGKSISKAFSLPLAGIGTVATKAAIDFESAFAGVRKTVNATEAEFQSMAKEIRAMAKEIPASAADISKVAEAAGQLGIAKENIVSFSRTMIDLGESTNLSAEEAASALAQFANVTQMSQRDFDRLGSVIVDLGNNLATTERDIVEMAQRLAGAGSQAGMSEAQIMAFAAALSSVGINAEAGGSSFSRLISDMQLAVELGGAKLQDFAAVAGISSKQFQKAFREDASEAILAFIGGLAKAQDRGMSAIQVLDELGIKDTRLRDALLRAAGASNVFSNALAIGNRAWQENNALAEEARKRYDTSASQLKILGNRINDVAIEIGGQLVPYLLKAVDATAGLTETFSKFSPEAQKSILAVAAVIGVGGPLMIALNSAIAAATSLAAILTSIVASPAFPFIAAGGLGAALGVNIAKWQEAKQNAPVARATMEKRTELAGPAQQIFFQRYGRLPINSEDYKKLDEIIADLAVNAIKAGEGFELLGYKAQTGIAKATGVGKGKTGAGELNLTGGGKKGGKTAESEYLDKLNWQYQQGLISADKYFAELESRTGKLGSGAKEFQSYFSAKQAAAIDVINERMRALVDGLKAGTMGADEFAVKTEDLKSRFAGLPLAQKAITDAASAGMQEYIKQVGAATAADIERINRIKQEQMDAQAAAAEGIARFWSDMSWEYSQGLLDAQSYFDMLEGELARVTQGSDEWKRIFEDLQRVAENIVNANVETLTEKLNSGKITTDEFKDALIKLKEQFQDFPLVAKSLDDDLKKVDASAKKTVDVVKDLGMTFQSAFEEAIFSGNSLREVLQGLLEDIAKIIVRKAIIEPLTTGLLSMLKLPFAYGGVISDGYVIPFATGGIVASPTIFPMAKGVGLMGEAGPEAIMPLTRTTSGELGVKAKGQGNGSVVNIYVSTPDADSFRRSERQILEIAKRTMQT